MWKEISEYVPNDYSEQVHATWMVERVLPALPTNPSVVDLGCGAGNSVDFFRRIIPDCSWTGIDIEDSPEVSKRKREDAKFVSFDGINIPLADNSVDLVFCKQVLEHVRHPEKLLSDVSRVLKDDGFFVGSTSHLEPYHSYSLWNFTPYGFSVIAGDAGLSLQEIRPGIDGLTLVERTFKGRPKRYSKFFSEESPHNLSIENAGKKRSQSVQQVMVRKLEICGHFCFICGKDNVNSSNLSPHSQ